MFEVCGQIGLVVVYECVDLGGLSLIVIKK